MEGGILRGQGRQHLGGIANVIVYWFIALPAGLTLAFKTGWGLYGLWAGMVRYLSLYLSEFILSPYAIPGKRLTVVAGFGSVCCDFGGCGAEE